MRRTTLLMAMLGALGTVMVLGGCGKKEEAGTPESAAPATESAAPAAPTAEAAQATATEAAPATAAEPAPAATADAAPAPAAGGGDKGKQIYDTVCMACHAAGVAGAPKYGDKDAWAPRIAQGNDMLYEHALKGFMGQAGMMPPKGGRADLPDADIKAAVDYMVSAAQ